MSENLKLETYEQISLEDINRIFKDKSEKNLSYKKLSELYSLERDKLELRDFRTTPYVFDKIKLNWVIASEINNNKNQSILAGHAISCEIDWSETIENLPKNGWSGATLRCYENFKDKKNANTLVGLFIHINKDHKNQKLSKIFIEEMKKLADKKGYKLIIPLRPPTRFEKKYCEIPFKEFSKIKRKDGFFEDYWLRQHQKFNAEFLDISETSHQHKMSLKIFTKFFGDHKINKTGYYTVNILGGWYRISYNLDNDEIIINQGCVWVKHRTI